MASVPPIRLSEAIVEPRDMKREYLVLLAIAAISVAVAVDTPTGFSIAVAAIAAVFVGIAVLAALPGSIRLLVDDDGIELRTFFLLARRVPWSAIGAIEVAEGWQGETVALEVNGAPNERTILGLPIDPGLGRRAFVTTFGLEPADLCARLCDRRDANRR